MKILMVNSFNYLRGGGERCFFDLSSLLEAHGHEVVPFTMAHPKNLESPYDDYFPSYVDFPTELAKPGLGPKLNVAERILYSREARDKIERLVADTRPDLVHIHGFIHEMSTSILPPLKKAGLPVIQTLHDYKIVCPNTTFVSHDRVCEECRGHRYMSIVRNRCKRGSTMASFLAGAEMYFHEWFRLYEPNIDLFISPSEFLARKVTEHGIRTPIVTIPNFINPDAFRPHYAPDHYFLFVGRLVRVKGIMTLLQAMRRLPDADLRIAGTGELEEEARAFVAEHGLSNVTFLGHLGTEALAAAMQRAAFTVVPSEWYENYSMTVIESLASGTPVVGANIGGIPEQVKHGQTGLLFPSGDVAGLTAAIRALLDDPEAAVSMRRRAREQVERLNGPETHYEQTMAVYQRALGRAVSERLPLAAQSGVKV
jgi:glycosyltransferase involved in cell wall biosynthesis